MLRHHGHMGTNTCNLVTRTWGRSGSRMSEQRTDAYGYNMRDELVFSRRDAEGAENDYAYQYDDIGNRITSLDLGTNRVYSANELNQYSSITTLTLDVGLQTSSFSPQFDDDGNQTLVKTATGIWSVTYNGENRPILWTLVNSSTPNSSTPPLISMSYDRMGRRVTKNNQRFVYDGYLQIANSELQTPNSRLQTFIWDPTEPIATRPLAWLVLRSLGEGGYYTHDGNKNVSEVVAENGDVAAHYEYAPFGALTVSRGASAASNPWHFSSEYAEDDTATVYYNYRHYEPVMGRWMSRDPIDEDGGCCLYAFASNMSISRTDRLGAVAPAVIALGVVSSVIYGCAWPQYIYAMENFGGTGDKFRHCLASCRIAKTCGAVVADLVGLGKEVKDRIVAYTCNKFPSLRDTEFCNGGHGDFFDSLNDLKANQACIGWESRVFGLVGSWVGAAFRQSCEDCCDCKIGKYNNNDNWE